MVDEVVSREGVDELALAAPMRMRDGHELAVACRCREPFGPREKSVCVCCELRGGDEDQRVIAAACCRDDRHGRCGITDGESAEQVT
jgi:hypothetical protein